MQIAASERGAKLRPWFYLIWALLAFLQAWGTELFHDEAYYWNYSRHLDWGYFHQPPMIALMIKAGSFILPGEIGVRLFTIIMHMLMLRMLDIMCGRKDFRVFMALAAGFSFVSIGAFLTAPDIPLLFFCTLFLFLFRKYQEKDSYPLAILLGLCSAAVLYSKYHGIFFLLTIAVINWRLGRRLSYWLIPLIGAAAFVPHVLWNAAHDFPAIRYHWLERMDVAWGWEFLLLFLAGFVFLLGPLLSPIMAAAIVKHRPQDAFERTLKSMTIGIFGIFLILSFRGRIETNWTLIALIPVFIIGYRYLHSAGPGLRKWFFGISILTFVLLIPARIQLLVDVFPSSLQFKQEYHDWDLWAEDIRERTGGGCVIFENNYKFPSKLSFYGGVESFSYNAINYSGNDFGFWDYEDRYQGKKATWLYPYKMSNDSFFDVFGRTWFIMHQEHLRSFGRFRITWEDPVDEAKPGEELTLRLHVRNNFSRFQKEGKCELRLVITEQEKEVDNKVLHRWRRLPGPGEEEWLKLKLKAPAKAGNYALVFGIGTRGIHIARNSYRYMLKVR